MSFFGLFRKTPEQQAAEAEQHQLVAVNALRSRHEMLLTRAAMQGLDPATLIRLIQFFGPLLVALLELWLKRQESR